MHLTRERDFDYILAGGGLQAGLLALAIRHYQPAARILVVERGANFGGNHTWSFHTTDIPSQARAWISRIPTHRWSSYQVRFPGYQAVVNLAYESTSSERLADVVHQQLHHGKSVGSELLLNNEVFSLTQHSVVTATGEQFTAQCVVDCRGQMPRSEEIRRGREHASSSCGFQKFYGIEVELAADWPHKAPTLMDACVDQSDGFHFIYVLPFTPRSLLVEDTWFSDHPQIDLQGSATRLQSYIQKQTSSPWEVVRIEQGCLPMPLQALAPSRGSTSERPAIIAGGYAGGWFHAATGYSFPLAVQFADALASVSPREASGAVAQLHHEHRFRFRFSRLLNRLLFRLVLPEFRWQIFRRLYRSISPEKLARFYAHNFSFTDAARMILGVPPRGLTPLRFIQSMLAERPVLKSKELGTST